MKRFIAGFLLFLLLPITANAADTYFQVDLVNAGLDGKNYDYPGESYVANPTGLGFKGGIRFNKYFAAEGSLVLGINDDDFDYTPYEVGINNIVAAYGVAYLPISYAVDIFAKLGMASVKYTDSDGDDIDGSGLSYGFGTGFYLGEGMMVIEYVVYPDTEYDVSVWGTKFTVDSGSFNVGYRINFR